MQIFLRFWNWIWNLGVERPCDAAPFDQERYAREEHKLTDAQQRAYDSVVREFEEIIEVGD
jgi:hypothetical protein